MVTNQRMPK